MPSLRLAAAVLDHPRPDPAAVAEAIRAIGVHARSMKSWKPLIENMLARVSKQTRYALREHMLTYFAAIEDYERACEFIKAPRNFSREAVYLGVDSLVELGRFEEAQELALRFCTRARLQESEDYMNEIMAAAAGTAGEHTAALRSRMNSPGDSPIACNIIEGAMESGIAVLIDHLDQRIRQLQEQKKDAPGDPTQIQVPGNQDGLLEDTETACKRWRTRLLNLISKPRRARYGLQ